MNCNSHPRHGTPSGPDEGNGRPGWNRTSNPQLRRLMLYPIELRAHMRPHRLARAATRQLIIANQGADWATMTQLPARSRQREIVSAGCGLNRADRLSRLNALEKGNSLALGPAAIVAVGFGEEGAVSAVLGFEVGDMRIEIGRAHG